MKIAILTFHAVNNYGAVMQAAGLYRYLEKCGHRPFFIDYRPHELMKNYYLDFRFMGLHPYNFIRLIRTIKFWLFRRQNFRMTDKRYYCIKDIKDDCPEADAYLVGSDQVWNSEIFGRELDEVYFCTFVGKNKVKGTYGSSFGSDDYSRVDGPRIKEYLSGFRYISTREKSSANFLNSLGTVATVNHVCDPSLLIERDEYLVLCKDKPVKYGSYVASYIVQDSSKIGRLIDVVKFAKNCPVVNINSPWKFWMTKRFPSYPSPRAWLRLICNAEFVVTNSFHGTVFSCIFRRPFVVQGLVGEANGKNVRIMEFLKEVGLSNRIVTDHVSDSDVIKLLNSPIDWEAVEKKLSVFVNRSKEYIDRYLGSI